MPLIRKPLIFFDLEGPLSPQDNAYEVLSLAENGRRLFEIISRYDDVLALQGRSNYEPGDTLKLIVPFLIYHGISEEDIKKISRKAKIVRGARRVISELKKKGWKVRIISTSYEQHAFNIGRKVGVAEEDIACTKLPLNKYASELKSADFQIIKELEEKILKEKEERTLVRVLDDFFFKGLQGTPLSRVFNGVTVIGGQRKVDAMQRFVERSTDFGEVVALGDSITDYKMLKKVKEGAGLAIVFNGNEFAVPYASVGVASTTLRSLLPITSAFLKGGKGKAIEVVKLLENSDPKYSYLENAGKEKVEQVINTHKRYRMLVRGQAGKLG